MYKGFNLELNDSIYELDVTDDYLSILSEQKRNIQNSLRDVYFKDGTIDAEKLKEAWFPSFDGIHVFISHAHSDVKFAERLACWLYDNFQIKSFIDSHVWGHANDLLREIDNRYAKFPSGISYSYEVRNRTTSNVHMLLSTALNRMMDQCETLLFINTNKSISKLDVFDETDYVDEDRTLSPWIMSELATSRIIEKKEAILRARITLEAGNEDWKPVIKSLSKNRKMPEFKVSHKVNLEHLYKLNIYNIITWLALSGESKGYDALTILYNTHTGDNFMTNKELLTYVQ
ncbi:hypothetical protein [Aeromonas dhakensis]|uniref:hypothetical protein n=1 Tax=Aeromonas dhakensis TaxID=196024 RepID=UPI003EC700A0